MSQLTIICASYKPNSAPTNRLLSMLRGLDEMDVNVNMVFVYPNEHGDRIKDDLYNSIHVYYLWKKRTFYNKYVKYLCSFLSIWHYSRRIKSGSSVLLIGSSEYLPFFTKRSDLNVYQERTEHFDVVPLRPRFLQKRYMKSIRFLNGMFVISKALKESYRNAGVKNVYIVNMIVDATRFIGLKKDTLVENYIAYCGTASNNKDGVNDLIKAFSIIHKQYPHYKLYIIGQALSHKDESIQH